MEHKKVGSPSVLGWGVRSYAWVVVLCVLALSIAAPILALLRTERYEASALIVATQLELDNAALPRLGESLFTSSAVAEQVSAETGIAPGDLFPERLSIVAAADSVVFEVLGRDTDPQAAADLTNAAAAALVTELNRPGAGVGFFALQDAADPPDEPINANESLPLVVVTAAIAGGVLGVGIIVLIFTWRRPILDPAGVLEAVGVECLGTLVLPRYRKTQYLQPRGVLGIASITHRISLASLSELHIASPRKAAPPRKRISVLLTLAIERLRPVELRAEADVLDGIGTLSSSLDSASDWLPSRVRETELLVVVDGAEPLDTIAPSAGSTATILVVPVGVPRERLRTMVAEYLEGELLGLVLFRVRKTGRRSPLQSRKPAGEAPPAAAKETPAPSAGPSLEKPAQSRDPQKLRERVAKSQPVSGSK